MKFGSRLIVPALTALFCLETSSVVSDASASPHTDYMLKCMGCHGPQGTEVPNKVPPLKGHIARFLSAEGGRAYLVQVPGTRQTSLSDGAVAELLNWLIVNFDAEHMPPHFTPYTEAEVARLRDHSLQDVAAERLRLLKAMSPTP